MFELNENFLEEVGLEDMPQEQQEAFLRYAKEQFAARVGERLSQDLDEAKQEEFDKIIDADAETRAAYLEKIEDYASDPLYMKLRNTEQIADQVDLEKNFIIAKWLEKNCPDYADGIREVYEALKKEIRAQKEQILKA